MDLSPIHVVPRSFEKTMIEIGTFYYEKIGLRGVACSNLNLSKPFLALYKSLMHLGFVGASTGT